MGYYFSWQSRILRKQAPIPPAVLCFCDESSPWSSKPVQAKAGFHAHPHNLTLSIHLTLKPHRKSSSGSTELPNFRMRANNLLSGFLCVSGAAAELHDETQISSFSGLGFPDVLTCAPSNLEDPPPLFVPDWAEHTNFIQWIRMMPSRIGVNFIVMIEIGIMAFRIQGVVSIFHPSHPLFVTCLISSRLPWVVDLLQWRGCYNAPHQGHVLCAVSLLGSSFMKTKRTKLPWTWGIVSHRSCYSLFTF